MMNYFFFSLLVSFVSATSEPGTSACPDGWVDTGFMDMGCLFFQPSSMKWLDALMYCRDRDANLVVVETELQMQYLRVELKVLKFKFWLSKIDRK